MGWGHLGWLPTNAVLTQWFTKGGTWIIFSQNLSGPQGRSRVQNELRMWGLGGTHTGVAPIHWVTSGKPLSGLPLEVQVVLGACHQL